MSRVFSGLCMVAVAALLAWGAIVAQDDPILEPRDAPVAYERVEAVLPYLSSSVPELRLKSEDVVEKAAVAHFDKLVEALPAQPRAGREVLLRILANTSHDGRVKLCLDTLCRRDARRAERTIAARALRNSDGDRLLELIESRLKLPELDTYQRAQCCALLGTLSSARAQGVAEEELANAQGGLIAFAAEDALLRSTIATAFAQPAWGRYQARHLNAPTVTLRDLQEALDKLALPRAADRAMAELRLADMIGEDTRVYLALARSPWLERSSFALKQLVKQQRPELQLAVQAVMLDQVMTGEQTIALMAMDVAIAGAPPTDAEMETLRPVMSVDSEARLEAILESMGSDSNLAALRESDRRLEARLRPLLLRRGAFDDEVRALMQELQGVKRRLEQVEGLWEGGWRREFQTEILGTSGG
ncbi:MAG: hypothetical protein K8I27_07500 [Planctomycetes bacterium]|nr:hypothetical protein [Planctomycetota bacterium]